MEERIWRISENEPAKKTTAAKTTAVKTTAKATVKKTEIKPKVKDTSSTDVTVKEIKSVPKSTSVKSSEAKKTDSTFLFNSTVFNEASAKTVFDEQKKAESYSQNKSEGDKDSEENKKNNWKKFLIII